MPVEMGMWRIDGQRPRRLSQSTLPSEATLEDYLERDPSLLGSRLLVIGQQVRTSYGKIIDLLAIDADGNLNVLELKRDKTSKDVVAQALDYGSWVTTLTRDDVIDIANKHLAQPFEAAFHETFGLAPPDEINTELQMTIIATELDDSSERIVTYLRDFGVPINAVFFSYLEDDDRRYLARSWLADTEEGSGGSPANSKKGKRAEWNGHDWYVAFGDDESRSWADGLKYGFISAGGGRVFSRPLFNLPVGARVNVHVPQSGYVAVIDRLQAGETVNSRDERQVVDLKEEHGRRGRDGRVGPSNPQNQAAAKELAGAAACMANTPGRGALIVGVADDGQVIGTELDCEWLRHRIYELTSRALTVDVSEHTVP